MSDFDFEAFITGTRLARATVGFYRVDHRAEIDRLTREHDAAPASGDDREGAALSGRHALAERIAALRAEMEASRVEMTIRTLTPDEFRSLQSSGDGPELDVYDQLAMQAVDPPLTRDQWKALADAVGTAQFMAITNRANDLVLSKVAVPDFSRSVSTSLNTPESSES